MTDSDHVVVVGAGAIGISAALALARDGHRVTVIARDAPGEGVSAGNAHVLATEAVVPVQTPGVVRRVPGMLLDPLGPLAIRWSYLPRIAPWLIGFVRNSTRGRVEAISIALAELLHGSVEAYMDLAGTAAAADLIQRIGKVAVYETEAGFRADQPLLELERRRGVRMQVLDRDELRQTEPALGPVFAGGVYYPDVAHTLDAGRLVRVMAGALVSRGGRVLREEVRDFDVGPDGPVAVVTDGGRHECDTVVIAAGAWSKALTARLGSRPPLDTERGYHVHLPEPGSSPRLPIYSTERGIAITPTDHGLRIAGTVELGGLEAPPDWRRADVLLRIARRWLPGIEVEGARRWMGFRPSMPDSVPVISRSPRFANVIFAFGHGHIGLTLGARTGQLVADLVAGREPGIDMAPYRVDRF